MTVAPSPYEGRSPVPSLAQTDGVVTLVEGRAFCLSGRTGDMNPDMPHGMFVLDTRVLCCWQLRIDGHRLEPLTVDVPTPFSAVFVGLVHPGAGRADSDVVVFRERDLSDGLRERWSITSYSDVPVDLTLECVVDVDFADLFAVKEHRVEPHEDVQCTVSHSSMVFAHADKRARLDVDGDHDGDLDVEPGRIRGRIRIPPRATWSACITVTDRESAPVRPEAIDDGTQPLPAQRLASWRATLPRVGTADEDFDRALRRAGEDLGALRIFDPDHPDVPIVAAGAPWFMTVFGRDSLLTAWMSLIAEPGLAQGVLETLARFQGSHVVAETEEEPGKILHEMRFGDAARPSLSSGEIYYGSVDATPLFVMLLGELHQWGTADDAVARLLPHAERALTWIERYGDRDGDGFVEYARRSRRGLVNQGWKDSWDGVRTADGRFPEPPIALCEVQGYVYGAYLARARLAEHAHDPETAQRYLTRAASLYERFNDAFWIDDRGWYAMALDGDKRPVDALSSNIGHCLWTGIVAPERARAVAERLMSPEMFSGWGVRTLAESMAAFNPISYHNGSVWPHDNAIVAAGLMRYGFVEEAHRVIRAQLDVATALGGRLPELFAGFRRGWPASPASYPTSCSPQAWAAAAPLLWLRTLLRLDPRVPAGEVTIDPVLPAWLIPLRIDDLEIGRRSVAIDVTARRAKCSGLGTLRQTTVPDPASRPPIRPG